MCHIINDDILNATTKYICHQVNCKGVMGAGLAKEIKNTYLEVYNDYLTRIQQHPQMKPLGEITITPIDEYRRVICMFGQDSYGTKERQTNYEAFYNCLEKIKNITAPGAAIAFPFGIGCGLGGGNWKIIRTMIEEVLNDREIYFYQKGVD